MNAYIGCAHIKASQFDRAFGYDGDTSTWSVGGAEVVGAYEVDQVGGSSVVVDIGRASCYVRSEIAGSLGPFADIDSGKRDTSDEKEKSETSHFVIIKCDQQRGVGGGFEFNKY